MPGIPGQRPHDTLSRLVEELEPVRRRGRTGGLYCVWLLLGWGLVTGIVLALGPLRPGVATELWSSPQFLLENLLGLAAGAWLAVAGFRLCIPGPRQAARVRLAVGLGALWVGAYAFALFHPALPPSMLGKRLGCELQVLLLGAPLLGVALLAARRLAPLEPAWTGALLGAAAGAIPGLLMQLACMYEPSHSLTHHLLPVAVLAGAGALVALRVLAPADSAAASRKDRKVVRPTSF